MTTFDYSRPKATASRLIARFGQLCTIRRASDTPSDPQTPWSEFSPNPPAYFEVTAIEDMQDVRDMSGNLVGIKRRTLTVDAAGVAPLKSDTIAVGVRIADVDAGTGFEEIVSVTPVAPAGVALMYEIELRS